MPIVPSVANPGHNGIADTFRRQTSTGPLRRTPPPQSTHHSKIADGVEPEGRGDAETGNDCSSNGRTDGTADVEADTVRRNGRCEVLLRNKLRHDRLPGGSAQSFPRTYQEGEDQQYGRRDQIEPDNRGE